SCATYGEAFFLHIGRGVEASASKNIQPVGELVVYGYVAVCVVTGVVGDIFVTGTIRVVGIDGSGSLHVGPVPRDVSACTEVRVLLFHDVDIGLPPLAELLVGIIPVVAGAKPTDSDYPRIVG